MNRSNPAARYGTLEALLFRFLGPITHVRTSERIAALTFDDGPDPIHTPRLLDVLKRHQAKATFFMVGAAARKHPEIVRAVAGAGHAVGNHSYSHADFKTIPHRRRIAQIRCCSRWLGPHESKVFRPPFGRETLAAHLVARGLGYRVVKWTISTGDWTGIPGAEISDRVRSALKPGSIILLHDASAVDRSADRCATIEAVDRILSSVRDYGFVTLPELLARGRAR